MNTPVSIPWLNEERRRFVYLKIFVCYMLYCHLEQKCDLFQAQLELNLCHHQPSRDRSGNE